MASNFFSRISERKNHKKQQKDDFIASINGSEKSCTPSHSCEKIMKTPQRRGSQKLSTTPVKNKTRKTTPVKSMTNNGSRDSQSRTTPVKNNTRKTTPVKSVTNNPSAVISSNIMPNLRLEAKTTAEENSRIFAGKEIHPFFSSWKGAKRCRELPEPNNNGSYPDRTKTGVPFGPIHVYERSLEEDVLLNWNGWIFYEKGSINLNCGLEGGFLLDMGDSVQPSSFDNLLGREECTTIRVGENSLENGRMGVSSTGNVIRSCFRSFDGKTTMPFKRNHRDLSNEIEYDLWANTHVPTKAEEVCGNTDSVKFLNEWLCFWYNKDADGISGSFKSNTESFYDDDCWHESGSDSASIENDDRPQNVLLITGPPGCGKSAAIYACAKEQGFQILELNTSDWRNGAHVRLRIGEALESHSVKWTLENSACLQVKDVKRSLFGSKSETIEPLPLSDSVDPTDHDPTSVENKGRGDRHDRILILFEDVDILFDEDCGFINAIVQLAETTKRPVILTSNCETPSLPHSLSNLHVSFSAPSHSELLGLFHKVSALENVDVQPQLMKRILWCCNGDMRKTMLQFQFWSLLTNDGMVPEINCQPVFRIDAGHRLLPKVMPWSFPSQLAELVEKEISRSLCVEETHNKADLTAEGLFHKAVFLRNLVSWDDKCVSNVKGGTVSLAGSFDDCSRHVMFSKKVPEASISMVSFVADTLKNDDEESADTRYRFFSNSLSGHTVDVPIGQLCSWNTNALHSCSHHFSGNENALCDLVPSLSADVSYVPDSLFIPEAEFCSGGQSLTLPYGHPHDSNVVAETSSGIFAHNSCPPEEPVNFSRFFQILQGSNPTRDTILEVNSTDEEGVGDSQFFNVDVVSDRYLAMDECSRIDFGGILRSAGDNPNLCTPPDDTVRAWGRLRARSTELSRFICEERDHARIVLFASEMSTFFCEADVFNSSQMFSLGSEEYSEAAYMMSVAAEHGFCYYMKHIPSLSPDPTADIPRLDLAAEMDTELSGLNWASETWCSRDNFEPGLTSSKWRVDGTRIQTMVRSMVPLKSYMSLKGVAVQDYFSALKHISLSEASRLSENGDGITRKRARVAPHYLVSGDRMMSVEDLTLLQSGRFHI